MAAHKAGRKVHRRHWLGAGGHSEAIAQRLISGRLISLDRDAQALELARERLKTFGEESDAGARAVLEDCGGRARVGDSDGGRGLGRLGGFEHAA